MNSPVETSFSFLLIDKKSVTPIYVQLMDEIIKAIQLGQLKSGYQLPGTRQLAKELGLNRNTIVKSLEELAALGWIDIRPNKGTFITLQSHKITAQKSTIVENDFGTKAGFQLNTSYLLDQENYPKSDAYRLSLDGGLPDSRLVNSQVAYKTYHSIVKRKQESKSNTNSTSKSYFVQQFLNYLKISRQLQINSDQIHFVSNRSIALQMISKVLFQPNDCVGIGDLNDTTSNLIFQSNKVHLQPISTDENGLNLKQLKHKLAQQPMKAVYLSSLHHYPTTVAFSQQQMLELVEIAHANQMAIIEENPLFEYYYTNRPLLPIAALYPNSNSIYIGDFGHGLTSAFQMHYIIGPSDFIEECKKWSTIYEKDFDSYLLETACALIREGEILRLEKKHRKIYRERRERMGNLLRKTFGKQIQLTMPKTGLGLWIEWKIPLKLMQLKKDALNKGLFIPQHLFYQTKKMIGMRIGFGTLNEEEIDQVIKILKACVDMQKKKLPFKKSSFLKK